MLLCGIYTNIGEDGILVGIEDSFLHHPGTQVTYWKGQIFSLDPLSGRISCDVCGWVAGSVITTVRGGLAKW